MPNEHPKDLTLDRNRLVLLGAALHHVDIDAIIDTAGQAASPQALALGAFTLGQQSSLNRWLDIATAARAFRDACRFEAADIEAFGQLLTAWPAWFVLEDHVGQRLGCPRCGETEMDRLKIVGAGDAEIECDSCGHRYTPG